MPERRDEDESGLSGAAASYRKAGPWIDASWQLMGAVLGLTAAGWAADRHFATAPWLLVAGACLGIVVGFYSFFRAVIALSKKDAKR